MNTYLVAFLTALFISFIITPVVRKVALKFNIIDIPYSQRKIHQKAIPRLGGLAIVFAFYIPITWLFFYEKSISNLYLHDIKHVIGLYIGGLIITLLGIYDDIKGTNHRKKFAVQFLVALLMYYLGYKIKLLSNPFGQTINLGVFDSVISILWIVGVINAVNLIDGLDGLASGVTFFAVVTTFIIASFNNNPLVALFCATLGGAVLGFLYYNFNPASIFMGDTGSLFLGFILSIITIKGSYKGPATVAFLIPLLSLGLPLMDTLVAMIRRYIRGTSIFSADREHLHHKLLALGLSQRKAVLILYGVCILFSLSAIGIIAASSKQTAILLLLLGIIIFIILRKLYYNDIIELAKSIKNGHDYKKISYEKVLKLISYHNILASSQSIEQLWNNLTNINKFLDFSELRLTLQGEGTQENPNKIFIWNREYGIPNRKYSYELSLPLENERENFGELTVVWYKRLDRLTSEEELIYNILAYFLTDIIEKIYLTDSLENVHKIYDKINKKNKNHQTRIKPLTV